MNGHWFCTFCNDVISYRAPMGRWDTKTGEQCPVCHNKSMNWVKHEGGKFVNAQGMVRRATCVTKEEGAKRFAEIRQAINLENPS